MSLFRACNSLANAATSSSSLSYRNAVIASASLHTSAVRSAESQKQRVARIVRKTNIEKKAERARSYEQNRPHVVLGTRPGHEETKWRSCDLAKILVTPEELNSIPPTPLSDVNPTDTKIAEPKYMSYGIDVLDGEEQINYFFDQLPETSRLVEAERVADLQERLYAGRGRDKSLTLQDKAISDYIDTKESIKLRQFARIVDLRNANARGIAFENRRQIIAAFSPTGKAADSGYPEVQVALLTMKIRNVWHHLMQRKKDIPSRRSLRLLIHQRAKMLKYIKRLDRDRYDKVLERVGVEPEAIEGELVV